MAIGISAGPSVVGTFGSERRVEYSALGEPIVRAHRLTATAIPGEIRLDAAAAEWVKDIEIGPGEASARGQARRLVLLLTASHELRSPLTSVQGFAELLMLERETLTPKQVETVGSSSTTATTWSACSTTCSTSPAPTRAGSRCGCGRPSLPPLIDEVVRTMRAQTEVRPRP